MLHRSAGKNFPYPDGGEHGVVPVNSPLKCDGFFLINNRNLPLEGLFGL